MVEGQDILVQKFVEDDLSAPIAEAIVKEYVAKGILHEVAEWVANLAGNQMTLEVLHAEQTQVSFFEYVIWICRSRL